MTLVTVLLALTRQVAKNWAAQRVLDISLCIEQGEINDPAGTIKLPDRLLARYKDETVRDSRAGTFVWSAADRDCPSTLSQIFQGDMRFYVNSSDSPSLEKGTPGDKKREPSKMASYSPPVHLSHLGTISLCWGN